MRMRIMSNCEGYELNKKLARIGCVIYTNKIFAFTCKECFKIIHVRSWDIAESKTYIAAMYHALYFWHEYSYQCI